MKNSPYLDRPLRTEAEAARGIRRSDQKYRDQLVSRREVSFGLLRNLPLDFLVTLNTAQVSDALVGLRGRWEIDNAQSESRPPKENADGKEHEQ